VFDAAYGMGGNKLYLEENGNGVFLDFGKNFGNTESSTRSFSRTATLEASMT
jgi:hypothetical protein